MSSPRWAPPTCSAATRGGADQVGPGERGAGVGDHRRGLDAVELEGGQAQGGVHGGRAGAGQAGRGGVDLEEPDRAGPVGGAGRDQEHLGDVAEEHRPDRAAEPGAVGAHRLGAARPGQTGPREGGDLARGHARQQPGAGVGGPAGQQRLGDHQRGQQRRRGQRAAQLLEHHARLERREARAVVLLGHRQRGDPDLLAQQLPQRPVEALVGVGGGPHGRAVGPLGQQRAQGRGQLDLLLAQRQLHQPATSVRCPRSATRAASTRSRWYAVVPHAATRARTLVIHRLRSSSRV